jgi:hypothetical protein
LKIDFHFLRGTPTYLQGEQTFNLGYYGKKASIKRACSKKGKAISYPAIILWQMNIVFFVDNAW